MKIGAKAPTIRIPCIYKKQITFLSLSDFQEKNFALCFLPDLMEADAWFLEAQAKEFKQSGSALAALASDDRIFRNDWFRPPHDFSFTFVFDPIRRLQSTFGLSPTLRPRRCETLIFDQGRQLRFRLIHEFNLKGFSAVLDMIGRDFLQNSQENAFTPTMDDRLGLQTVQSSPAVPSTSLPIR